MNKMLYHDAIKLKIAKAIREKDDMAVLYYMEALKCHACVSFDIFSKSWAGQEWIKKNSKKI